VPIDPTANSSRPGPRDEPLGELAPPALRRVARRHLLRIYSPQQAAVWLTAHATGDPIEVACKAQRLSGGHERGSTHPSTTASPACPAVAVRAFGDVHDAATLLPHIIEAVRATLVNASRVVVSLAPPVAEVLLGTPDPGPPEAGRSSTPAEPDGHRPPADLRRCLMVPIVWEGSVLGALHLYADGPEPFDEEDRAVAALLAARAAAMVRGVRPAVGRPDTIGHDGLDPAPVEGEPMMTRRGAETYELGHVARQELVATRDDAPDVGARSGTGRRHQLTHLEVHEILLTAIRDIFTCEQPEEIQAVLLETVARLGGHVVRAAEAGGEPIPIDLSLTLGEPLLAIAPTDAPNTGEHLWAHLPRLVEDARQALERVERTGRLASDAEHDALTGLFNRRAYERFAGRLRSGDVLVLLDLDGFKTVNDTRGHLVGDQVLRIFGAVLRDQMRITEQAVRLGGDEFLIVLEGPGDNGAELLLERLQVAWNQRRPVPVSFSSGVAVVTTGVDAALEAADRALYEHKRARRGAASGGSR
jgi:diguanylate cyclase (GGDEF)-like protein